MNISPLISVIVPIYKVELYLDKCIDSIVNQTYKNLEIILVDDGSPDECPVKCDEWAKKDSRIQVVHKKNGGLSSARNAGIINAKGEYLYFLDSDDSITPNCLELLVKTSEKYPMAQIVQAGASATEGFSYLSMNNNHKVPRCSYNHKLIKWRMLWSYYPVTAWNKLIKRQWLLKHSLFFKEGLLHEDVYWTFFAAKHISVYAVCKHDTYLYNIRPGSITQAPNERNIQSWIKSLSDFLDNIDDDSQAAQRALIYRIAATNIGKCGAFYQSDFRRILKRLLPYCGFFGKMIVSKTMRCTPKSATQSKFDMIKIRFLSRFV